MMPVVDQTLAGLGAQSKTIHAALKRQIGERYAVKLVDELRFDQWMDASGPHSGEYWLLAHGTYDMTPLDPAPEIVVVPVCITRQEKDAVFYHLELNNLELRDANYTKAIARMRQDPAYKPSRKSPSRWRTSLRR